MDNSKFIVAPVKNRFFAFLIDVFFVYLIRFFYTNIALNFWLKNEVMLFLNKYKLLFGDVNLKRITNIEVMFFLRSNLFKELMLFVAGIFIISIAYDIVFQLSKWSATLGQKFLGIYVISKNGEKIRWYQAVIRGIMINIPWIFISFIMFSKELVVYDVDIIDKQTFIISIILFLSWYDMIFLTKNKIVFHDYVSRTLVVVKNKEKYAENRSSMLDFLFPNPKGMYEDLKGIIKKQIEVAKEMKRKYKEEKNKK